MAGIFFLQRFIEHGQWLKTVMVSFRGGLEHPVQDLSLVRSDVDTMTILATDLPDDGTRLPVVRLVFGKAYRKLFYQVAGKAFHRVKKPQQDPGQGRCHHPKYNRPYYRNKKAGAKRPAFHIL